MSVSAAGPPPGPIRLGHAFPNPPADALDWVSWTYEFLQGRVALEPRAPTNTSAVALAEALLGIDDTNRPVYSYAGCLHPALGRIGLVLSPGWLARGLQGGTKCDSGGLAGALGGFACLASEPDLCREALLALSFASTHDWHTELNDEVTTAYGAEVRSYVRGTTPEVGALDSHRRRFVEYANAAGIDDKRRLWTWEIRVLSAAMHSDVYAVAMATEAYKLFDDLRRDNGDVGSGIKFLVGSAGPNAVDHFHEPEVVEALAGFP